MAKSGDNLFVIKLSDSVQKNTNGTTSNRIEEYRYKNIEPNTNITLVLLRF